MHLKEQWNRLDPATQQWLTENPGCQIVPRTVTALINKETSENADVDIHGGTVLTEDDRAFIRAKARQAQESRAKDGQEFPAHHFFDASRP